MNMFKFWKSIFFDSLMFHLGGGGGGGGQPQQTTVQNTNIPEYARPYVETMLGATQQQLFNTTPGADGTTQITGVKPYQAFGQEGAGLGPGEMAAAQSAVAPFDPLQQQAYQTAAGLGLPSTYGQAADITGMGIAGAMGTAGQAQGLYGMGRQAAGAGQQYARQATNPYAVQAYMNPYLESALAPQIAEATRQSNIAGLQAKAQAAQQGAFGGSRQGLMESERQRNLGQNISNIVGQGYNQAFNQAQQAQQFGANLGLQGLQAGAGMYGQGIGAQQAAYNQAMQGAGQLAGIGGQALQAQQGILGVQSQMGAQQQQQQQNIINQAIQNYATAQQYPQQQLAFMNSMLRGLPLQTSTTQSYQAAPSMVSQLGGLGLAGAGAYRLATGKKGGLPKNFQQKRMKAPDNREKMPGGLMGLALNKIGG